MQFRDRVSLQCDTKGSRYQYLVQSVGLVLKNSADLVSHLFHVAQLLLMSNPMENDAQFREFSKGPEDGMCKISVSSHHHALDQRSRERKSVDDLVHRNRLQDGEISPITKCLMRRLRLRWKRQSRVCTSEGEQMSKSNVPKKNDRFLRERQILCMIYEDFRDSGGYEAVRSLSNPFSTSFQNDDVQDFDTKWDQVLLAASEKTLRKRSLMVYPSHNCRILWGFRVYCLCMNKRMFETSSHQTTPDNSKASYWLDHEESKLQSLERKCGKRNSNQESRRKESLRWEESGRVFSMVGTWTMFKRRLMEFQSWHNDLWKQWQKSETKRTFVFSRTRAKAQTDGKMPSKESGRRGKSPSGKGGRIPCRNFLWRRCTSGFHGRNPCAPKFVERTQDETFYPERCVRRVAWDLAKNVYKLKSTDKSAFYFPIEAMAMLAPTWNTTEEWEFVVHPGASMHTLCNKDLSSEELEILRRSSTPTMVVTAVVKCKLTRKHRYTLTILSSSWRCKYSMTRLPSCHFANSAKNTVISGQKAHQTKQGRFFARRKMSCLLLSLDCRQLQVPTSSSSTSLPQDSSSTFSSPATQRSDDRAPGIKKEGQQSSIRRQSLMTW